MKNNSKEVVLEFNLPGFKKEDINLKLSKDFISIKAEKKHENKVQKKDFFHHEKSYQAFNYTTTLPKINPKKARMEFERGVLKITAPKE